MRRSERSSPGVEREPEGETARARVKGFLPGVAWDGGRVRKAWRRRDNGGGRGESQGRSQGRGWETEGPSPHLPIRIRSCLAEIHTGDQEVACVGDVELGRGAWRVIGRPERGRKGEVELSFADSAPDRDLTLLIKQASRERERKRGREGERTHDERRTVRLSSLTSPSH